MSSNVVVIAGPTASGKSWLGAAVARAANGVVINADSQQLYAALPILTAQPTTELTELAPHRLYGVIDPATRSTAAAWAEMARAEIDRAHAQQRLPILVGGTGLYLEALMQGMAAIPPIGPEAREAAQKDLDALGREAFYARLIAADPASQTLQPGDTQRILRAWEVLSATGRSLKQWQEAQGEKASDLNFHSFVILPPRESLRAACDQRFVEMVERGAVEEVAAFLATYGDDAPAARALGFKPLSDHLAGNLQLLKAIEIAQAQTRQYAKRQSTWFRNRFARTTLSRGVFEGVNEKILSSILTHLPELNHN